MGLISKLDILRMNLGSRKMHKAQGRLRGKDASSNARTTPPMSPFVRLDNYQQQNGRGPKGSGPLTPAQRRRHIKKCHKMGVTP